MPSKAPARARATRPGRPLRPDVPALPPLEALDRTHHQMLAVLEDLERLPDLLESQGAAPPVRQSAHSIGQFFAQEAQRHHRDEEQLIFPALLDSSDVELVQQVRRLQQDHGWLEEDWIELAPQLSALSGGDGNVDPALLRHIVDVFASLYREHIALEESLVYPAARRLRESEKAGVAKRLSDA